MNPLSASPPNAENDFGNRCTMLRLSSGDLTACIGVGDELKWRGRVGRVVLVDREADYVVLAFTRSVTDEAIRAGIEGHRDVLEALGKR